MNQAPISLSFGTFVVEYALVAESVVFHDRKNLIAGGAPLGAVPRLAICKDLKRNEYRLFHCDSEWNDLCSVESSPDISELKGKAERRYEGISEHWKATGYTEEAAKEYLEAEFEDAKCSFCGESWYEWESVSRKMIASPQAKICSECVSEFYEGLQLGDS